jgi:hypothetical protein
MDVERIIDEIEQLQGMFEAPDIRPLSPSGISAANRRHDEMLVHSPWFRLWQHFGVCCRGEAEGGPRIQSQAPLRGISNSFRVPIRVRRPAATLEALG